MTSLTHTKGEKNLLIDNGLGEWAQWLGRFVKQMANEQRAVVYGVQGQRKGGLF